MRKSLLQFSLSLAAFLAFLAVFSAALQNDAFSRFAIVRLLLIGVGLVIWGAWALRLILSSRWIPLRLRDSLAAAQRFAGRVTRFLVFAPSSGLVLAGVVMACITVFSIWYASLGLFPTFPRFDNLYVDQAEAFLHGQLALLETPSPEILALSDPYSYEQRNGIPYLWDASLYNGRYYLYSGPVPAVILSAIMGFTKEPAPSSLLVLLSAVLIPVVLFFLLWGVQRHFYSHAPVLSVGLFLFVASVNLPFLFLLGRGRMYETSIITGQLFLLLGITGFFYFILLNRPGWLFLAGLGWGLAVACRYNLALSTAVFAGAGFWVVWRRSQHWKAAVYRAAFLIIPLAVCAVGLGMYNWLRFDNPLETGLKYQLTTPVDQNRHFSPTYLQTSLYLNVLYPYRQQESFPLIRSIAVVPDRAPEWVNYHPGKQNDETIFGLRLVPVLWLLVPLLVLQGGLQWSKRGQPELHRRPGFEDLAILRWATGIAGFLQFTVLLFYYYSAVRFMADYYLLLLLTIMFLLWQIDSRIRQFRWPRILLWGTAVLAVILTAIFGFLGGFDNPPRVFEVYNPAVEAQIASAWDAVYTSPGMVGKVLRYLVILLL